MQCTKNTFHFQRGRGKCPPLPMPAGAHVPPRGCNFRVGLITSEVLNKRNVQCEPQLLTVLDATAITVLLPAIARLRSTTSAGCVHLPTVGYRHPSESEIFHFTGPKYETVHTLSALNLSTEYFGEGGGRRLIFRQ